MTIFQKLVKRKSEIPNYKSDVKSEEGKKLLMEVVANSSHKSYAINKLDQDNDYKGNGKESRPGIIYCKERD